MEAWINYDDFLIILPCEGKQGGGLLTYDKNATKNVIGPKILKAVSKIEVI